MRARGRRLGVAAIVALALWVGAGCSGGDDASESREPGRSEADAVAESWGEPAPRVRDRTRAYLAGKGAGLREYVDFAAGLGDRLDTAAYADGCGELRGEWDASFGRRRLVDWLYGLPDPVLGRFLGSQVPAVERALRACADGDQARGSEAVEAVDRLQELVDRRYVSFN